MRSSFYPLVLLALAASASTLLAQDSVLGRVADLFRQTRYEQATDLLDSGSAQGPQANWWRARLTTDPARFQELALTVAQDGAIGAQLQRDVTLARAREHFAAGRYQSAEGLLRPLAENRDPADGAARLWWGMSLQASGEARAATRAFESVP